LQGAVRAVKQERESRPKKSCGKSGDPDKNEDSEKIGSYGIQGSGYFGLLLILVTLVFVLWVPTYITIVLFGG
jgi:hypothetical protein